MPCRERELAANSLIAMLRLDFKTCFPSADQSTSNGQICGIVQCLEASHLTPHRERPLHPRMFSGVLRGDQFYRGLTRKTGSEHHDVDSSLFRTGTLPEQMKKFTAKGSAQVTLTECRDDVRTNVGSDYHMSRKC